MASFGDKLKREREMRGVTLDEISESTKIARRHLEALEADDFSSLPGGVFNKGFVKAYARFIGINEEQAVADYCAAQPEEAPSENQFPLEIHEKPDRELNPRSSHLPLIGAVVALVLVVAGYAVWRSKHHQGDAVEPVAAASAPETASSSQPAPPAASESASIQANVVAVDQKVPSPEPQKALVAPKIEDAARSTKLAPPERTFFVVIKAKEDSWISVMADGRRVSHGILKADKQKFVRAGKQILVTTGNAGGIDVSYNGKPMGVIGNESEARTLLFTPTGVAQQ